MNDTPPRRQARDPLIGVIRRSRLAMGLESLVRAFWPLGSALTFLWAALAFGLAEVLTRPQVVGVLGAAGIGLLWLAYRGIRRFRWPSMAVARARIDANLPGRPLAALRDAPALGRDDPAARAVWAVHLARMRRAAAAARPVQADLRLARFDPLGLRLLALVAAIAAAVFAGDRAVESVAHALQPPPAAAVAGGPSFEGWAEPPAYTGQPTLYLPEVSGNASLTVPSGTIVTLRVYGEPEEVALSESVSGAGHDAMEEAAPGIRAAAFPIRQSGEVALAQDGGELGRWSFDASPDAPPEIGLAGAVEAAAAGEMRLPYRASDDYGIEAARAVVSLDAARADRRYGLAVEPEARPDLEIDLPMPLSGGRREIAETLVDDFSKHPFAGLPVTLRLVALDAVGQTGESQEIETILPIRPFYDPLALALVEQRRDLLWSAENGRRVMQVLRAASWRPDGLFDSAGAYLMVRAAIRRLASAEEAGDVAAVRDEVAEALWQAAVRIEDGNLGDAAERLAKARERLREALRNDASDEEIARLMDELRQATRDYMEEMARNAIERGEMQQAEIPPGQTMTQDQIQELMDRIQELSEQGRKAEAEALLEMLQQLLDNMQMMMGQNSGQGQQGEGQNAMQGLADALREQQGLADESFRQLQEEFRQGRGEGQPGDGQQQGQAPGGDFDEMNPDGSLAERQEALRQLMEELEGNLPGAAGEEAREALREAERNMGAARDGLESGETAQALDRQAEAIDNLREGMREMGEDLRRAEGEGGQGDADGQARAQNDRDPLGRPYGNRGSLGSNERLVPEADSAARARELLDEIRRRSGERARPQIELDYLRRLLDWF